MVYAWHMHGICMAYAWHMHPLYSESEGILRLNPNAKPDPRPPPSPNSHRKPSPNLNQGASATTDSEAAEVAEAGTSAAQLLAVALQDGPRGPEVSNLQTDSAELFYAVRSK